MQPTFFGTPGPGQSLEFYEAGILGALPVLITQDGAKVIRLELHPKVAENLGRCMAQRKEPQLPFFGNPLKSAQPLR